jgi:hypothetical protein
LIYVRNRAIRHGSPEVLRRLREGIPVFKSEYYFRSTPVFETAIPELRWMTRTVFIGDGERFPESVAIRFWRVL